MRVTTAREKNLPSILYGKECILRNVDLLFSAEEAKRIPLEKLGDYLEGNIKAHENPNGIQTILINEELKIVTVVFNDGAKQIVKCSPEDSFDTEIGFALAFTRAVFGSKTKVRKYIEKNAKVLKPKPKKRGRKKGTKVAKKVVPEVVSTDAIPEDAPKRKRGRPAKKEPKNPGGLTLA